MAEQTEFLGPGPIHFKGDRANEIPKSREGVMNTNTGDVEYFEDGRIPEPRKEWIAIGEIVSIAGKQWKVYDMKKGGRLFLKLVKS